MAWSLWNIFYSSTVVCLLPAVLIKSTRQCSYLVDTAHDKAREYVILRERVAKETAWSRWRTRTGRRRPLGPWIRRWGHRNCLHRSEAPRTHAQIIRVCNIGITICSWENKLNRISTKSTCANMLAAMLHSTNKHPHSINAFWENGETVKLLIGNWNNEYELTCNNAFTDTNLIYLQ